MNLSNDNNRFNELAEKWLKGTISSEEMDEYNQWYNSTTEITFLTDDHSLPFSEDELRQRIMMKISSSVSSKKQGHRRYMYQTLASVAAVVLLLVGLVYWREYFGSDKKTYPLAKIKDPAFKNDILPGSNKAVLTLANGRKIVLDSSVNGIFATQGNTKIIRTANGNVVYKNGGNEQMATTMNNTMSTPRGAQYQLLLSDGTKVWLNAGSSMTYPTYFKDTTRRVRITGEVYFEVAKNTKKPFIVSVGRMDIRVLGTHFNVNAYVDDHTINTTLLEGKVEVIDKKHEYTKVIAPGQQAQYSDSGKIKVVEANTDKEVAWKNGMFEFDQIDIFSLMKQVSRWYDINVTYKGQVTKDQFTGIVPRNVPLTELLTILKYSKVHFELNKNNLVVLP